MVILKGFLKVPFQGDIMGLKLLLAKDGKILCEIFLSPDDWVKNDLEEEFEDLHKELQNFTRILSVFMNENRLRMLQHLMKEDDLTLSFTDFRDDLRMNPKMIREHTLKLKEVGFLKSPKRGKYKLSKRGEASFMMTSLALRRMLKSLWEECEE